MIYKKLKNKKKKKKHGYVNIKLFFIKARKKVINYNFELAKDAKVYLVFYMLQLRLKTLKRLYKIYFITKFKKKTNLKLKKF